MKIDKLSAFVPLQSEGLVRGLTVHSAEAAMIQLDRSFDVRDNWSHLASLEAFYIKKLRPSINEWIKASRELDFFFDQFDYTRLCYCVYAQGNLHYYNY